MYYQAVCKGTEPVGVEFDKQVALIRELLQQINDLKNNVDVASADDFAD
jgi:superfamily I DNA and/or RNA helicase